MRVCDNILKLKKVNIIMEEEVDSIYLAPKRGSRAGRDRRRCQFQHKEAFLIPAGLQQWGREGGLRNMGFPWREPKH